MPKHQGHTANQRLMQSRIEFLGENTKQNKGYLVMCSVPFSYFFFPPLNKETFLMPDSQLLTPALQKQEG